MNRDISAYCYGRSLDVMDIDLVSQIRQRFSLTHAGQDLRLMFETHVGFCFFFYSDEQAAFFDVVKSLCEHLQKPMLVFFDGSANTFTQHSKNIIEVDVASEGWEESLLLFYVKVRGFHPNFSQKRAANDQELALEETHSHKQVGLKNAVQYIDQNFAQPIREQEVADYCHYSVNHFSRIFHQYIGISFRDYVTRKRIEHAKFLLLTKRHLKINFIAFQCGYRDVSYFSRIFKKKTGISPAIFRSTH